MKTIMNENNQQQKEVEMEELQQLLKDVYEATKGIKQGKKEPFNVFELCIATRETRHSQFLAELLNPHGSHGLGPAFLKAFYEQVGLKYFPSEGYSVRTEVVCSEGKMDIVISNKTDIVVSNKTDIVVIENKINAEDQPDQLKRYSEWLNDQKEANKKLIYLTLDGHEASNAKDIDYQRISYRNDILKWLDKCIAETFKNTLSAKDGETNAFAKNQIDERNAFVKKLLLQYKELIQKLTGMDMEPEMKNKISEVITSNEENYLTAALTAKAFDGIHQGIIQEIAVACKPEGMQYDVNHCANVGFASFAYVNPEKQYKLFFEFQKGNYKELCYGLHTTAERPPNFLDIEISFKCIKDMGLTFQKGDKGEPCYRPNRYGWFFAIEASKDFRDWDAESFADRWKNRKLSFQEIKKEYEKEIKNYIGILNKIINDKENQGKF